MEKMHPGKCYYQVCKTKVAYGAGTHSFILLYDNAIGQWREFRGGPGQEGNFGSLSASDNHTNRNGGPAILRGSYDVLGGKESCEIPSTNDNIPDCTLFEIPNCNGNTSKINYCFQAVLQKVNSLGVIYKPFPEGVANLFPGRLHGNCNTLTSMLQDICLGNDKTVFKRPGFLQPGDKEFTLYYQNLMKVILEDFPQDLLP